jgi:hypothetical protein
MHVRQGTVKLFTRRGHEWTNHFHECRARRVRVEDVHCGGRRLRPGKLPRLSHRLHAFGFTALLIEHPRPIKGVARLAGILPRRG